MDTNVGNKILLSVVSGTFNRINSLQKMVQSVRNSFENNEFVRLEFAYEIVLVDGGSTDGTIEWCKSQSDIRLIEHGKLLGAVKAFNDGAFAAYGKYVILANDDIEFIGDSIVKAVNYMLNNKYCGIGCFYQDRHGQEMHVEYMPAVQDGRRVHVPYGQVCIVPKWLGDSVGWWGNYLRTYGGDNELSCRVYELGYAISPIEGAQIHDRENDDELRKINNIDGYSDPRSAHGHHPDSFAWGNKWSRNGMVGAIIESYPLNEPPKNDSKRILYLPIFEQGWDIQKTQKRGLRNALAHNNIVLEFDYVGMIAKRGIGEMLNYLAQLCLDWRPDIVLTQIHNASEIKPENIQMLKGLCDAVWINWNGDFWPDNLIGEGELLNNEFDIVGLVNRDIIEKYNRHGINAKYWQIGWEPDGRVGEPEEFCEVIFLANGYSNARRSFVKQLRNNNYSFSLYGNGWPPDWTKGQTTYDFISGCKLYRGAKIALGDSQWPETGFVSNRIFQILCTGGCALFHQWFAQYEHLGLIDKENCVIWNDVNDLKQKIDYYLSHQDELKMIADNGEQLALEKHSFESRVNEMFGFIDDLQQVEFTDWR